jgi:hypothetical protein
MKSLPPFGSDQPIDGVGGQAEAKGLAAGDYSLLVPGQFLAGAYHVR